MAAVTVRPVAGRRDLNRFIKLPFRLRRDDPQWVPPLIFERRQFLDRARNPFFDHAEARVLPGRARRRGGRPDHAPRSTSAGTSFQGGSDGMFGFFDSEDDPEVAAALVDAAGGVGARAGPGAPARADGLHAPTTSAAC